MAIGRTFQQAFAKALRSRELDIATKLDGVDAPTLLRDARAPGAATATTSLLEAFRKGASVDDVRERTLDRPVVPARSCARWRSTPTPRWPASARTSRSTPAPPSSRRARRTTTRAGSARAAHEVERGERPSVVILGSGPNRIGQGIEFDYCCVHAAMTVRESGRDAVMINCNPETVSTDYDTSDRLYFEPLTLEDVLGVIEVEQPEGVDRPVRRPDAAQARPRPAGGRASRSSARASTRSTSPRTAGASARCSSAWATRRRPTPPRTRSTRRCDAVRAGRLPAARAPQLRARRAGDGDRLLARRPGRLPRRATRATGAPIYLDRFLENAIEVDVDALCDGEEVWIGGIMQHVEEAGIHSGDSACVLPPHSLGHEMLDEIRARDDRHRARPGRRRAHERPVRRPRRRALRDRGQPARLAHRALRLQGDRRAAGQARLPDHARRADRRPRPARRADAGRSRQRQGGGAAVRPPRGLRRASSGPRCARPARSWASRATSRPRSPRPRRRRAPRCPPAGRPSSP